MQQDEGTHHMSSQELCNRACEVAENAYAPYSGFRVGAAVMTDRGVFSGTNVENASYGLGFCAERAALAAAVTAGAKRIKAIAVACIDATGPPMESRMPCGSCRQWIAELAPAAKIFICDVGNGVDKEFALEELLPHWFRLAD